MKNSITPENLREWGIVGAGGAGFPSEVKCRASAEIVIVNAAECEPLLHKDKELLRKYPEEMLDGLREVMRMVGASRGVIGIKEKYRDVIEILQPLLPEKTTIFPLRDFYPAGDEFVLVYAVTGRVIPPGGIPLDVDCVVNNVETLINISRREPVIRKYLTVAGAVNNPVTVCVPVGTSFRKCLEMAGGATVDDPVALVGGVMMGRFCDDFDITVMKTTGGLIIFPREHRLIQRYTAKPKDVRRVGRSACDQCSFCTELCPRYLLGHPIQPHLAMRSLSFAPPEARMVMGTIYCCECNLCTLWSCPEDLDPRAACIESKPLVREAGLKWTGTEVKAHPLAEDRRMPVKKLMSRLDLNQFVNQGPLQDCNFRPDRVVIPVVQHIGAPAEPVVKSGDRVKPGDLIAKVPEGKLGAHIHSTIEGVIKNVGERITIERG